VDATYVYFSGTPSSQPAIFRASKAGGSTATILASFNGIGDMAFDGSKLFVMGTEPAGISTHIYSVDINSGAITWLVQTPSGGSLHVDAERLAWREPLSILWMNKIGGTAAGRFRAPAGEFSLEPALSPCGIVWASSATFFLSRFGSAVPIPLVPMAWGQAFRSVVDDNVVYWTDQTKAVGRFRL
jgi:hypothetical protein